MNSKEAAKIICDAFDRADNLDIDTEAERLAIRITIYIVIKAFAGAFKEEKGFDYDKFESECYGLKS